MKINQIAKIIHGKILSKNSSEQEYFYAFASDLMSDVLCQHRDDMLLISGLATIQTIRTVELSNIGCVIIARGKKVSDEMLDLAHECGIDVVACESSVFEISGKLYANGIKAIY